MQEEDLFEKFFDAGKKDAAYKEEREYRMDLLSTLDMLLFADGQMKSGVQDEMFLKAAAASAVKTAKQHIKSRLIHTSDSSAFCYQRLIQTMNFTEWECFLVLLTFSVSHDAKYETAFSKIPANGGKKFPTLRLAIHLYQLGGILSGDEIAKAVQKQGVLFYCCLETAKQNECSPTSFTMSLSGRVCAYLYGRNEPAEELAGIAEVYRPAESLGLTLIRKEKQKALLSYMQMIMQDTKGQGNVIQIYGPDGIGKRFLLQSAAKEQEIPLLFVDTKKLLKGTIAELRILFRKLKLESLLLGAVICFTGYEPPTGADEAEKAGKTPPGLWFLLEEIRQEYRMTFWLSVEKADVLLGHRLHVLYMELPMLSIGERMCLWKEFAKGIPVSDEVDLESCASRYALTPLGIKEVLWDAGMHVVGNSTEQITKKDIQDAVKRQRSNQLGTLAALIKSVYTWDDLVIKDESKKQLEMICSQVKFQRVVGETWGFYKKASYGRGISAIFYGAPGTGKTMAAQVMANELGLSLYRVDISQIFSKYIGETEKNITDLFHRARHTNALLFFDEADSLFAKRSEVKDSHDRNANTETAHLLQKLEDYDGICILATNFIGNIDEAFKRRIKFMVNFVFPAPDIRLQLWESILPKALPIEEEIDFAFFAEQFELSGSSIKEILTNAAFLAAAEKRGLKNEDIVEAVRLNFAKYGRVMAREEFGYMGGR